MRDGQESDWNMRDARRASRADDSSFVADAKIAYGAVATRWRLVAGTVAGFLILAIAYIWTTPPIYSSSAEILIDPRGQDVFQQEIVPSGMGSSSLGADTFLLDSQVEMIMSRSLLRQVIDELELTRDAELRSGGGESGGVIGGLKSMVKLILRGPNALRPNVQSLEDRVLANLRERLDVSRSGNTYVIEISVEMEDPTRAADIANAIAAAYLAELAELKSQRILEIEEQLGGRLDELRAAALASEERAERYRAENGLIGAQQLPLVEQQLRDLNQQLTVASSETTIARSRWEEIEKLSGQSVEALLAAGSIDSSLLASLVQQYAAESAREASLLATLLPGHPSVRAIRDAKASLQADVKRELDRLVSRYRAQYEVAAANEAALRNRLDELEAGTAASNQASVTLRDLEREAQSDIALFQQFLVRSKDAREQVNLPSEVARIISEARPSAKVVWPAEFIILAAALFLGGVSGVGLAILMHLFGAGTPPRSAARPTFELRRAV